MRKLNLFLLIFILAAVTSFITFIVIERNRIVQVETYPMQVRITDEDKIGMNADPDGFYFGGLRRGMGAGREFWIQQVEEDVMISIIKKGEMAKWVGHPNEFIVRKGEEKKIELTISIPQDAPLGNYTGEVIVILKKV